MDDGGWAEDAAIGIGRALAELADPDVALAMAAYMRDQFAFLGVKSPARQAAWRTVRAEVDARHGRPDGDELVRFAALLWEEPARELRYVAAHELGRRVSALGPAHLDPVRRLIVTDSWWDTVDVLAPRVVGSLAQRFPDEVVPVLDHWIVDEDHWLIRSAIIHQLGAKERTDVDRLERYCTLAAPHDEFFVRKAIGWALRQYSYIDPARVEEFVATTDLSPLSTREAMKAIIRTRP